MMRMSDIPRLREALAELYTIVNNRILGAGENPSLDLAFRKTCHEACARARVVLDDTKDIASE